jgi:hypothetical protein
LIITLIGGAALIGGVNQPFPLSKNREAVVWFIPIPLMW